MIYAISDMSNALGRRERKAMRKIDDKANDMFDYVDSESESLNFS